MLLVDDLLLAPIRSPVGLRKIHDAAQEEMLGEADAITEECGPLHDAGDRQVTEAG